MRTSRSVSWIITALVACFLIACGSGLAQTDRIVPTFANQPDVIYFENQMIELAVRSDRVAVFYALDLDPTERRALSDRHDLLAGAASVEEIPSPAMSVFSFADALDESLLRTSLQSIAADLQVARTAVVYHALGIDLIANGQIFIQLEDGLSSGRLNQLLSEYNLELVAESPVQTGNFVVQAPSRASVIALSSRLRLEDGVRYSEPDFIRRLERQSAPNDPLFGSQWGLEQLGTGSFPRDVDIDAPEGWEIQEGCASVTIAILDEGCDMTHPDYVASLVGGWDFPGNDADPTPNSWDGHGTACAGVAAAVSDNSLGVAGVAGGAKIMPIRIAYSASPGGGWVTTTQWLADAITWAYANGADVLSNSWGGGPPSNQIHAAIQNATLFGRGGLGSVVAFAAGNYNVTPPIYPSLHSETVCVGATSPCDERKNPASCDGESWWGSNYGAGLDVSAPGVLIPTTDIQGSAGYDGSNYFMTFNGTSSATPHVAGLAALVICKYPHYTVGEVRGRIEQTCDKVGGYGYDLVTGLSDELGHGRINMYRALSGKPQVAYTASAVDPSVYQDESDEYGTYPHTKHLSAAYEWLGEEYSPERSDGGTPDPDGIPNVPGKDAFDDGVKFRPPYVPGQMGTIEFTVSVENSNSIRYVGKPLYVNIWMDWEADDVWNTTHDWVLVNFAIDPSGWGGAQSMTYTHTFLVPDVAIDWHIQNGHAASFLNTRTRLTYNQTLTTASATTDWGEVEDDRFLNYVEMFNSGPGYTTVVENCPVWHYYDGATLAWTCHPGFTSDTPTNGYMCAEVYHPTYDGDDFAQVQTPSFDLSELTEATLMYEYCGVEFATGRVKLYNRGTLEMVLRTINHPLSAPPCGAVVIDTLDLTPFCDDNYDDVVIAFETYPGDPCGAPSCYQDWKIDNIVVWGQDRIAPTAMAANVTPTALETADVDWVAPGDDGMLRQAELYNIRYAPEPITASNWRHSLWLRPEMASPLPTPAPPGTAEIISVQGLTGGLHHFSVRTLDEVNNISGITSGGQNLPPVITVQDSVTVTEGDQVSFSVAASDPDFDPVQLFALGLPAGATFTDNSNGTGDFDWTTGSGDVGNHTIHFTARDTNGLATQDSTTIVVLSTNPAGACCLPDDCCKFLTASSCSNQGGAFQGAGTDCDPNPCGAAKPDFADHDTGNLTLTMTDQGIIGFMDGTQAQGSGFVYPAAGANQLYVGSLWVGNDISYVANRDYDADPDPEWKVSICPDGRVEENTSGGRQTIDTAYDDSDADTPFGLYIRQESWAFSSPQADDDFVIVRYFIHNHSSAPLSDLRAGLFLDLDLEGDSESDTGDTDLIRDLAYLVDPSGLHAGVRLLEPASGGVPVENVTLVHNPTHVWPLQYVPDADKFGFLAATSGAYVMTQATAPDDYSLLVSAGPLSLGVGDSSEIAFAIVGGQSETALLQNADRAQAVYDGGTSTVESGGPGSLLQTQLLPSRPNPFRSRARLAFRLGQTEQVDLAIYDVSGRLVRSLVSESLTAGEHNSMWEGLDDNGQPVAGGVYYARLRTEEWTRSRPVVLLR